MHAMPTPGPRVALDRAFYIDRLNRYHSAENHHVMKAAAAGNRTRVYTLKDTARLGLDGFGFTWAGDLPPEHAAAAAPAPAAAHAAPSPIALDDSVPLAPPPELANGEAPPPEVTAHGAPVQILETAPDAPPPPAALAVHDSECPICGVEPRTCPQGHTYHPVSDSSLAIYSMMLGAVLVGRRSAGGELRPLSSTEEELLKEATKKFLARYGGSIEGKWSPALGIIVAAGVISAGTFENARALPTEHAQQAAA